MDHFLEDKTFQKIVRILGLEKSIKFFQAFSGKVLYIPKVDNLHRLIRNSKMLHDFDANMMTYKALREKYNLSESQIRNIIKEWKQFGYKEKMENWFSED